MTAVRNARYERFAPRPRSGATRWTLWNAGYERFAPRPRSEQLKTAECEVQAVRARVSEQDDRLSTGFARWLQSGLTR
jgi:hypothetical protein